MDLTQKEEKLFQFIESYQMEFGKSPILREMREHMELKSDGFVVYLMKSLQKKGVIQSDGTPRGIKLLPKVQEKLGNDLVQIPVLGYVPAGGPVLTEEFVEDWVSMDAKSVKRPKDTFMLRVRGNSMVNAGIFDRDYVLVYSKAEPKIGDIVVALIDNENTVKRYMKDENGRVYLQPENEEYEPIYPEDELIIQGKVIGLFRWYV